MVYMRHPKNQTNLPFKHFGAPNPYSFQLICLVKGLVNSKYAKHGYFENIRKQFIWQPRCPRDSTRDRGRLNIKPLSCKRNHIGVITTRRIHGD